MARRAPPMIPSTTAIISASSSGGVSYTGIGTSPIGKKVSNGAGTANVLANVLTVSGSGYCPFLVCYSNSATPAHTIRCQVIVDGTSIFDATSDTITTTLNRGFPVVDCIPSAATSVEPTGVPIRFNSSLVVNVASSQSGSDYVAINYDYHAT